MNDNEIMTLEKAIFILRHGSAEGLKKYLEAIDVIEKEINRQKAEIVMLQSSLIEGRTAVEKKQYVIEKMNDEITWLLKREKITRAEAIKEFAERLKKEVDFVDTTRKLKQTIDNLVKEMTGERE